ncbi:MAG: DNA polymerase I [Acidobacteriota bacterium]
MDETVPKRLFLIDGMSTLYRAFFAIRNLSNSRGLPTNAIFGFTMTLRKLIRDHHPDYLGVVLDSKEPTFRQEKFEQYKGHRKPMPEEMVAQLPYLDRLCEALRIPIIRLPKYEADDIMGTLAEQAATVGVQTVLVTNDKDLAQLVSDPLIVMLRVEKSDGGMKETLLDAAGVKEKYGVRPEQIVEWLGLTGDTADGFEGGFGIGPKGATLLLEQFGSVEKALAGWEEVKRKNYREGLRDHADKIRLALELAEIDRQVPVSLDLEALKLEPPDRELAHQLFTELEFNTLSREFAPETKSEAAPAAPEAAASLEYAIHTTNAAIDDVVKQLYEAERLAFSLHTDQSGKLIGMAFSSRPGSADYLALDQVADRAAACQSIAGLLENGLIEKVTHDWKRALHLLGREGMVIEKVTGDTLIAGYLLRADDGAASYETLQLASTWLAPVTPPAMENEAGKVARIADLTGQLETELTGRLGRDEKTFPFQQETLDYVYHQIDLPLIPLLYEIERAGFGIDPQALATISVEMEGEIERLTGEIYQEAGREFNIASPAQLGEIFEELNYEVTKRTSTGKIATGRDVLDELALKYALPRLIIEHRELSKLKGTYVDALPGLIDPADGRIHTTLNQTVAATGRLSSTDPNLQNIPIRTAMGRRIRRAFIPAPGYVLLSADYSQIELRLLAHVTQDPVMLRAFQSGEDIHERTAREVFGARTAEEQREKRRVAKIVNFGIAYVIGPYGLAQRVGMSRAEAKRVIDDYYRTYAEVKRYMDELPEKARAADCTVRSIYGRLRHLPELKGKGALRAAAEREAVNMPMQGSASDIVKLAMIGVDRALRQAKLKARMILQVHDELVLEVPRAEVEATSQLVRETMEQVARLDVPLPIEIGIGDNWMDAKP